MDVPTKLPSIAKLASLPKVDRDQLRVALDEMKRNIETTIEFEQLRARIRGEKLKSLMGAGFSRVEALQIIIADK